MVSRNGEDIHSCVKNRVEKNDFSLYSLSGQTIRAYLCLSRMSSTLVVVVALDRASPLLGPNHPIRCRRGASVSQRSSGPNLSPGYLSLLLFSLRLTELFIDLINRKKMPTFTNSPGPTCPTFVRNVYDKQRKKRPTAACGTFLCREGRPLCALSVYVCEWLPMCAFNHFPRKFFFVNHFP